MPIGCRETQVVFHRLAHHNFVRIIVPEREIIVGIGAFKFDGGDIAEKVGHFSPFNAS